MKKKWLKLFGSLTVSVGIIAYLFSQSDVKKLLGAWERVQIGYFVSALIVYLLLQGFRALRFRALIGRWRVSFPQLFLVMNMHGAINRLFPLWTGEAAMVLLLRRMGGLRLSEGSALLILARGIEVAVHAGALSLLLFIPVKGFGSSTVFVFAALMSLGVLATGFISVIFLWPERISAFVSGHIGGASFFLKNLISSLLTSIQHLPESAVRQKYFSAVLECLFWTTITWISNFSFLYLVLLTAGWPLPWEVAYSGMYIMMVINVLPLRGVLDLGFWEGAWTGILLVFGFSVSDAMGIALISHAAQIAIILGVGGVAAPLLGKRNLAGGQERVCPYSQ